MEYKVGDRVRIKTNLTEYESDRCAVTGAMVGMEGQVHIIEEISCINHNYKIFTNSGDDYWWFSEEMLEPVVHTLAEIKEKKLSCVVHTSTRYSAEMVVNTIPVDDEGTIDNDWSSFWDNYKGGTCYKIVDGKLYSYQNKKHFENHDDDNGNTYTIYEFSDLFPVGSTMACGDRIYRHTESGITNYKLVPKYKEGGIATLKSRDESVSFASAPYLDLSFILPTNSREFEEKFNEELAKHFNAFPNDGISAKNGGKNSMKFTFYTEEGYRIDKSNNSKVETITTFVKINGFDNTYLGMATCDKVDYSEREGVINALANAMCNGNFDREYNKAVKANAFADKKARTCTYCGKLFDTVAEKEAHESWHIERRKARHERYLLRKRAKEIAFEEQAQNMAKEMIKEDK